LMARNEKKQNLKVDNGNNNNENKFLFGLMDIF
jgi:hypothetical protein